MADRVVESLIPDIERRAAAKLAQYRLPGLVLGIVRDQELAWCGGFGAADLERAHRPDEHSIARVASVTKTFTTTAILQLRDQGRLGLDDPLVRHIPEFGQVQADDGSIEGVTIRRLLTHRSGLVTEPPAGGWATLAFPGRQEILAQLPQTRIVLPQDVAWKYSNLGFGLLGEVVYRLANMPYIDYVGAHIIEPLGLESAVFELTGGLESHLLTGYNPTPYQDYPERASGASLNGLAAAGQLYASVGDLARWVSFQFRTDGGERRGAQVLDGSTLAEIQRPQYVEPDWSAGQCLGWRVTRVGDHVYHNHGGGIYGFSTQVWFNVPRRTGAISFINMWPPPGGQELVQEVLELILAADEGASGQPEPPRPEPMPEALRRFVGYYCAAPGIQVHIEFRDGGLRLVGPPGGAYSLHAPAALEPTGQEGQWRVEGGRGAGETAVFTFDEEGRVLSYELGAFVFEKYAPAG